MTNPRVFTEDMAEPPEDVRRLRSRQGHIVERHGREWWVVYNVSDGHQPPPASKNGWPWKGGTMVSLLAPLTELP